MFQNARLFNLPPLAALRAFDRLVNAVDPFAPATYSNAPGFPAVNLWEKGDTLMAEAEVPGLKMEDLEVLVIGDELTIKGQRPAPTNEKSAWHRQERGIGEFSRIVTLPYEVNSAQVEATLKDGVLTIVMPKAEQARARKIDVKAV